MSKPLTGASVRQTFTLSQFFTSHRLLILLALMLPLPITTAASSADYQKGLDAYDKGDYATALKELTPLAEQGAASAQLYLGFMYGNGEGVPQDYKTAVK